MGENVEGPQGSLLHPRSGTCLTTMAHTYQAAGMGAALLPLIPLLLHHIPGAAEGRKRKARAFCW